MGQKQPSLTRRQRKTVLGISRFQEKRKVRKMGWRFRECVTLSELTTLSYISPHSFYPAAPYWQPYLESHSPKNETTHVYILYLCAHKMCRTDLHPAQPTPFMCKVSSPFIPSQGPHSHCPVSSLLPWETIAITIKADFKKEHLIFSTSPWLTIDQ